MSEVIKEVAVPEETVGPVPAAGLSGFLAKFTVLKGAQRELWLTFLIKFLIYTAYSVTNKTMVLWLSKDLGFSDQAAGALVGWVWAPAMTVFTLLAGSLTDAIGLRRTFFLGVAICTVARSVMVVTTNPALALACGVLPLAVGEALGTPVLLAATRRYSTTAQRSISFSIIYMVMNIGYVAAGWIFDYVRQLDFHINIGGFEPTTHQQLFIVSLVFEILLFPAIYFLRRSADGKGDNAVLRRSTLEFLGPNRRDCATKRGRHGRALSSANRSVGFLSPARLLPLHWFSQSDFPPDGLRLPEVGRSRARISRASRKTVGDQFDRHHSARPGSWRVDPTIRGLSDGDLRRCNLRGWSIHHGAADGMVSGCGEQRNRPVAWARLSRREREHSPLLHHGCTLLDCVLDWGGLLLTAGLRVRGGNCAPRAGSFIRFAGLPSISRW